MGKTADLYKKFLLFAILFCSFSFFNCGGGGGGDDSTPGGSAESLSRINGRVSDVFAFNFGNKPSAFSKLKILFEFTESAWAQGSPVFGITVVAIQIQGGMEVTVDQDVTDGIGTFSLDVPPGEIILQFFVGGDVFEELVDITENSTIDIVVSIDADDPVSPIQISDPDDAPGDDDDDTATGEEADQEEDVPMPVQGNGVIISEEVLVSVNSRRAQGADCGSEGVFGPQGPLTVDSPLEQAALGHSNDMAVNNFFSHTGSDGSSPIDRMNDAGFAGFGWGENITASTFDRTTDEIVDGWMGSDGHCANIMEPAFNIMGAATASNSMWNFWTLNLGAE